MVIPTGGYLDDLKVSTDNKNNLYGGNTTKFKDTLSYGADNYGGTPSLPTYPNTAGNTDVGVDLTAGLNFMSNNNVDTVQSAGNVNTAGNTDVGVDPTAELNFTPDYVPPTVIQDDNTPSSLQVNSENVINNMLSGSAIDPLRQRNTEATARGIANLRANRAQQVSDAGLLNQGAGQQALASVEQQGLEQISQNNMDTALAEQQMKVAGVGLAQNERRTQLNEQIEEDEQSWNNINFMMSNDNWDEAAQEFEKMTGNGTDMSKVEDRYDRYIQNQDIEAFERYTTNVMELIDKGLLPPEAAQKVGATISKGVSKMAENLLGSQFTDQDWIDIDIALNTPDVPLTGRDMDMFSGYVGSILNELDGNPTWDDFMNRGVSDMFFDSDNIEADTEELGSLASAFKAQSEGAALNEYQREILKKHKLYTASTDASFETEQNRFDLIVDEIKANIDSGDFASAKAEWDKLTDAQKEKNPFETYVKGRIDSLLDETGKLKYSPTEIEELWKDPDLNAVYPEDIYSLKHVEEKANGVRTASLTNEGKQWFEDSKGKIVTMPDGSAGVLMSYETTPTTIVYSLRDKEGKSFTYEDETKQKVKSTMLDSSVWELGAGAGKTNKKTKEVARRRAIEIVGKPVDIDGIDGTATVIDAQMTTDEKSIVYTIEDANGNKYTYTRGVLKQI